MRDPIDAIFDKIEKDMMKDHRALKAYSKQVKELDYKISLEKYRADLAEAKVEYLIKALRPFADLYELSVEKNESIENVIKDHWYIPGNDLKFASHAIKEVNKKRN